MSNKCPLATISSGLPVDRAQLRQAAKIILPCPHISMVQKVIDPTRRVLLAARNAGIKIIYLKMGFLPDLLDLGDNDSPNRVRHLHFGVGQPSRAPDGREGRFLIRDTWNTDIVAELRPLASDVVLYKHRFSGFYQTAAEGAWAPITSL